MALIRGSKGLYPCPVCLVPKGELADLSKTFELRTKENMKAIYEQASDANTAGEKEIILKAYSLRDIKVSLKYLLWFASLC